MDFFIGILIGVISGWWLYRTLLRNKIEQIYNQMDEMEQLPIPQDPKKVSVKFERINGLWYVYQKDNDMFLTQGKTYDDIIADLEKRYPDIIFMVSPTTLKKVKNI